MTERSERLVMDPREMDPDDVPNSAWVPVAGAYLLTARSRVTVYRWVLEDRLAWLEIGEPGKAQMQHVRAGDVRELEARMFRRRAQKRTTIR